ncbi:hypothetical protein [Bradyrhizobium elkanii]|uniref:hypothetical protein n=1 Tax=Bradyrhizobium elkanii TaxID=29448 RepID=UPI00209FEE05|nr:hypothetical protein [Bradyrhizobium elkanii]MCP1968558.1 hypothetical protein [Bradyrhizobium elkanii]MCS4109940.1 hypothetical protein [Bradyrhizobium elkanii]
MEQSNICDRKKCHAMRGINSQNEKNENADQEGKLRGKRKAIDSRCEAWGRLPIRLPVNKGAKT